MFRIFVKLNIILKCLKAILAILDGWGLGLDPKVSAIAQANTPFIDSCLQKYPHSKLEASGLVVGLPAGQMGNSEVGHMNLGAGRVIFQNLVKLNMAVENKTLGNEPEILAAFKYAKTTIKDSLYRISFRRRCTFAC